MKRSSNGDAKCYNIKSIYCYCNLEDKFAFPLSKNIEKELRELNELEENYGFLSCIGVKLVRSCGLNEIEGFIRAPDNSPYKNGIFNFIIKIPEDYPMKEPEVIFKTKIFHTEFHYVSGKCCIYFKALSKTINLSLILIGIYEFFLGNNDFGYGGEALELYRKNLDLFYQKCQEYTKKYSFDKFPEDPTTYLLEDYCDSKKEFDGRYTFIDFTSGTAKELLLYGDEKIERIKEFLTSTRLVLLSGNNIYYFEQKKGDSIKSLGSNIIFIAPDINRHDNYMI